MDARAFDLASLQIATPCSARWEEMVGDERVRHCAACDLDVYDAAHLTEAELRALVGAPEPGQRVCMRLLRRADGRLVTRDCPVGVRRRRVRVLGAIATGAGVLAAGMRWSIDALLGLDSKPPPPPIEVRMGPPIVTDTRQLPADTRETVAADCERVYTAVVDELHRIATFDGAKDRARLDKLSRMLLEGCIDKGRQKGLEWKYLADAYNLRGRIEFYWVYTDKHFEVPGSVRKDHIGLAHRDLRTAMRLYEVEGAQTQLRLRTNPWMPEHQHSAAFVLDARRKGIPEGYAEVRPTTALMARDDVAHFLAAAVLPQRDR